MHIDNASRQYKTASGERRTSRCYLLRRSYRDEQGRPRNQTLANLSALPDHVIEALGRLLAGAILVNARRRLRGEAVGAARGRGRGARDGLEAGPGRAARPGRAGNGTSPTRWCCRGRCGRRRNWPPRAGGPPGTPRVGADLGVADASTDEIYAAMDWLTARQRGIEKKLAARHLTEGGIAMFDLSSSWVEGSCCELAAFGHSRDGKRGRRQIEYGLLTDPHGRPVAVEVFAGNTSDPESFKTAITRVRTDFGIERLIMVGDRGMITGTRIDDLRKLEGMDWITALKAPAIKKLAEDGGPLQMSLFDTCNFAEITHPDYPGERLVCCHNPVLEADRARTRAELLADTEAELAKIHRSVTARAAEGPGQDRDPGRQGDQQAEGRQALHSRHRPGPAAPGAATRRRSPPRPPSTAST